MGVPDSIATLLYQILPPAWFSVLCLPPPAKQVEAASLKWCTDGGERAERSTGKQLVQANANV